MKIFSTLGNNSLNNKNIQMQKNLFNKFTNKNFLTFYSNNTINKSKNKNIEKDYFISLNKFNFAKRLKEQMTIMENSFDENMRLSKLQQNAKTAITPTPNKSEEEKKVKKEEKEEINKEKESSTKVSSKLLCELIGCKHYPSNEEIKIEEEAIVNVYDESDKFLGKQTFLEATNFAREYGKDIILRNDRVTPPVVKIMRYKVELVKRLMKKLGKTVESEKKENIKYMTLSQTIGENDYNNKRLKIKELLAHFSYIRIVIPCDIANNEAILKCNGILNTLSNDLSEFCRIKAGPIRQKQKKEKQEAVDTKITDSIQKIQKQEREIKEAYEISKIKEVNSEKDLEYISSVYIDYESLLMDNTGINYENLLENVNLENLLKGITKTNLLTKVKIGKINFYKFFNFLG